MAVLICKAGWTQHPLLPYAKLRPFTADDANWLVAEHARHYAEVDRFDDTFAPLVAGIIDDFLTTCDPKHEAGWIAEVGGRRIGSIFCVRQAADCAKLRLFYVVASARGTGVADLLLNTCLDFARQAGYAQLQLWTHQSHVAAGRIYARHGFTLIDSKPVHSFGQDLVEETWQITL